MLPYFYSIRNRFRFREPKAPVKAALLGLLGLLFWAGLFALSYLVLDHLTGVEIFGPILAKKLLSMVLMTFFFMLVFSNIITALTTFYLSEDLGLILASPVSSARLYGIKLSETLVSSSWMIVIFAAPVFLAYAVVFRAGMGYFLQLVATLVPFFVIPASLGILITMTLVLVFPARNLKNLLFVVGLAVFVGLFVLFRLLRPERLVDSEVSQEVMEYLAALRAPSSIFLPSSWATDALAPYLFPHEHGDGSFYLALLVTTALAAIVIGNWVSEAGFYRGWSKAQEAGATRPARLLFVDRMVSLLPPAVTTAWRGLMVKDLKTFFRDTTQWSQLLLLLALVVIYLYNFSVLPLKKTLFPGFLLESVISFVNIALAGFVLSAVGARLVFPAVSLEGRAFWIIQTAPVGIRSFLWSKFWAGLIPLLVLAEILVLVTNHLLGVDRVTGVLSVLTIFTITLGVTGLGVGLGAVYPRFTVSNPAHIATGFGGMVYMIVSLIYIGVVVAAVAWPAYRYLDARYRHLSLPAGFWVLALLDFCFLLALNLFVVLYPLRLGERHLTEG
jgi:ABC-2 type transport system permease protein